MDCRNVRRLIDEAGRPESIPIEAARHAASCGPCQSFADERVRLRQLLASSSRVAAPANFDAVLRERLARGRTSGSFGWLTAGFSLRLAGAAATLMVAVFAAQFYLTGNKATVAGKKITASNDGAEVARIDVPTPAPGDSKLDRDLPAPPTRSIEVQPKLGKGSTSRVGSSRARSGFEPGIGSMETAAVLLTRDPLSERQFTVSAISVGAQPIVSFDGDRQRARIVRTSF